MTTERVQKGDNMIDNQPTSAPTDSRIAAARRIAIEALPRLGIATDAAIDVLPVSENVALRVTPRGQTPIVLRVSPEGGRSDEEIRSELAWITALEENSAAPVSGVVACPTGETPLKVTDPLTGVVAPVAVFKHVDGHEPGDDELASVMPRLGRISAQLHEHSTQWSRPGWFTRGCWDDEAAFGSRPTWGRWQAAVPDPQQRALLERAEATLITRLRSFGRGPERFGLIHADLRTANLLVEDDGEHCHIIDFDDAGFGWWLYDLATALTFYENQPDRDALIDSWVTAYREVRPLPDDDVREIPTFLLFRRLLTLAFLGNNPDIEVTREMLPGLPEQTCELAEDYLHRFA